MLGKKNSGTFGSSWGRGEREFEKLVLAAHQELAGNYGLDMASVSVARPTDKQAAFLSFSHRSPDGTCVPVTFKCDDSGDLSMISADEANKILTQGAMPPHAAPIRDFDTGPRIFFH